MTRELRINGDRIEVRFEYHPDLVRGVREATSDHSRSFRKTPDPHWSVALTPEAVEDLLPFAEQNFFLVPQEILEYQERAQREREANLSQSAAHEAQIQLPGFGRGGREPYPFQKVAVAYAARAIEHGGVLIADEMGLGKTIEALAILHYLNTQTGRGAYPAVVACPAFLKENWRREALKWLPEGMRIVVLEGREASGEQVAGADIVIINYDILTHWSEALGDLAPVSAVFDEIHYLKNSKAQRTKAAFALTRGVRNKIGLTGTPVLSRPEELISQLKCKRMRSLRHWRISRTLVGSTTTWWRRPRPLRRHSAPLKRAQAIGHLELTSFDSGRSCFGSAGGHPRQHPFLKGRSRCGDSLGKRRSSAPLSSIVAG